MQLKDYPDSLFELDGIALKNTESDRLMAQYAAFQEYAHNPDNAVRRYVDSLKQGTQATYEEMKHKEIEFQIQGLNDFLTELLHSDPDEFREMGEYVPEAKAQVYEEQEDPMAPFQSYVRSIAGPDATPEEVDAEAEHLLYMTVLASLGDEGAWKTAKDFFGFIFWPNESFIGRDITGSTWWNAAEGYRGKAAAFSMLPREERVREFLTLVDTIQARTENSVKAANALRFIVDPAGADSVGFELAMDKIGLTAWAVDLGFLGKFGLKGANVIRSSIKTRNEAEALLRAIEAAHSKEMASAYGMTQVDGAAHLTPFFMSRELFEGAPDALKAALARHQAEQRAMLKTLDEMTLKEGLLLSPEDKAAAQQRMMRDIYEKSPVEPYGLRVVADDELGVTFEYRLFEPTEMGRKADELRFLSQVDGMGVDNYRIVRRTDDDVTIGYTIPGEDIERTVVFPYEYNQKFTVRKAYTLDDVTGGLRADKFEGLPSVINWLMSPQAKFTKDVGALLNNFTHIMYAQARYRKALQKQFADIYRATPKKDMEGVAYTMQQATLRDKPYTYAELKAGLPGVTLSDEGIEAYFKYNQLMDTAWVLKNRELRQVKEAQGVRAFTDTMGEIHYVREYGSYQSAREAVMASPYRSVVQIDDMGKQRVFELTRPDGTPNPEAVRMMDEEGFVLIRKELASDMFKVGSEPADRYAPYLMVKRDRVGELPTQILDYRPGYMPLIYEKDAIYFGQQARYGMVEGRTVQVGRSTPVYFTNRVDAEEWARTKNFEHFLEKFKGDETRAMRAMEDPNEVKPFNFKHDREIAAEDLEQIAVTAAGGRFTGARASERLQKGLQGEDAVYRDPYESMQMYLDNIANHLPLSVYRVGIEDAWLRKAKELGVLPHDYNRSFRDALIDVQRSEAISADQKKFLVDAHKQISYQTRVPSIGERDVQNTIRTFAEKLERVDLYLMGKKGTLTKALHRLDHADPVDAIKAATFHVLLGALSPAQYFVQGFGSTVAMAADPMMFSRVMPRQMAFATLDNIQNPQAYETVVAHLSKALGDPDLRAKHQAWVKTGLKDDIVFSSADFRAMVSSHYLGKDQVSRLFDKGLFFYKGGELFNRRYSFLTAMERRQAQGLGITSDADIKAILDQAQTFMLNMQRTNKAEWQKGWLGIPTQFMQVHTKFLEALGSSHLLDPGQRFRLFIGQAAIFGSLGVPFGNYMASHALSAVGVDPGGMSEGTLEAIRGGIIGFTTGHLLGINNVIGQRGAIPHGVEGILEAIWEEEASWSDIVLGATGGLTERVVRAASDIGRIIQMGDFDPSVYDDRDMLAAADAVLDIFSSWNNASAAYEAFNNPLLRNRRGVSTILTDELNTQTKLFKGLGFDYQQTSDMYTMRQTQADVDRRLRDKTDTIVRWMYQIFGEEGMTRPDDNAKFEIGIQSIIKSESPEAQRRILDGVRRRILEQETVYERTIYEYVQRIADELNEVEDTLVREQFRIFGEQE